MKDLKFYKSTMFSKESIELWRKKNIPREKLIMSLKILDSIMEKK